MSNVSKRKKEGSRTKIKSMGDHKEFLKRITQTLYYGQLPSLACLSLPVTEISCDAWSAGQRGRSLRRLHRDAAARIAHAACVSPCALVLALLYLERLNACNPDYVANAAPADLFLVSLMVGNKFLQDDGEDDDVLCSEWASSGNMELEHLKKLELEFLTAIDWNVFVSEQSFAAGLSRLERRVALRQATGRGFFTYGDLARACASAELLRPLSVALASLALASLAGAAAVLAAVAAHSWLQPLPPSASLHTAGLARPFAGNDTLNLTEPVPTVTEPSADETLRCCAEWIQHRRQSEPRRDWNEATFAADWKSPEPWWSTTSVLNWLYRRSLVDPVQRWLEKMTLYADFALREWSLPVDECGRGGAEPLRCVRQWLHPSRLGAILAAATDR